MHVTARWPVGTFCALPMQPRQTFNGVGAPRFQVCSIVGCGRFRWSLFRMFHLAYFSARSFLRAARLNTADRRSMPTVLRSEARVREGLGVGSTAGRTFRSGEGSASSPPAGSKSCQCQTPACLKAGRRPSWPMNRSRKRRSLSSSMSAREATSIRSRGGWFGS